MNNTLYDIFTKFVKRIIAREKFYFEIATVKSVNESEYTAIVNIYGETTDKTVNLSVLGSVNGSFIIIPKVDSRVLIGYKDRVNGYVVSVELASKIISNSDEIIYNLGENEGLVKVLELTDKLNNLENKVNSIISSYNTHVHTGVTTGDGSSEGTPSVISGTLTPTTKDELQNDKIKH